MKKYILFWESYHDFSSPSQGYIKSFEELSEAIDFSLRLFTVEPRFNQESQSWFCDVTVNPEFRNTLENAWGLEGFEIMDAEDGKVVFNSRMLLESYVKRAHAN